MSLKLSDSKIIQHLLFAEDQVIVGKKKEEATCMFRNLKVTYDEWGLKINRNKTAYVAISRITEILLNGINTKTNKEIKHLRSIIY